MIQVFLGCSYPFLILLLILISSFFCARIIASDESKLLKTDTKLKKLGLGFINPGPKINSHKLNPITHKKTILSDLNIISNEIEMECSHHTLDVLKPSIVNHYACPPTSLELLRRRYGTSDFWGDWSNHETRQFYLQQLPLSLQSKEMRMTYF
jgi:hypothetical protein